MAQTARRDESESPQSDTGTAVEIAQEQMIIPAPVYSRANEFRIIHSHLGP